MDFKFVLPIIVVHIEGQTQLEVNWTQIDHVGFQKTTKLAISENAIFAKCQSPKSLLLLYFSMNLFETFRIDVNMDFANNIEAEFYFRPPKQF